VFISVNIDVTHAVHPKWFNLMAIPKEMFNVVNIRAKVTGV
jgi:hypothetical protein